MSDLESESDNDSGDNGWSGDEDEFQGAAAAAAQPHKKNQKKSRDGVLELWANRVLSYSSQYNNNTWSADMIIGKPKVYPRYGDLNGAWAQGNCTNNEFIEIEFEEKLYIESIEIYETLNAGAVTRIAATDAKGSWKTLWQEEPRLIQHSRIFRPSIEPLTFMTNQLRLELDCTIANTWCEIDAVKIIGKRIFVEPPFPLSNLSDELKSLVNSPTFSDCSFDVAGTKIHAHRAILAARSEYFRAMFTSGMVEGHTINLKDFKIVAREELELRRKIREAVEIRVRCPDMNHDIGYDLPYVFLSLLS